MLKLIENALAKHTSWSCYDISLRWPVILNGWWSSFRIGEMLPKTNQKFDSKSSLLVSDLTFQNGSVSFWILSTKITKEKTGDIVEVWEVPCRQDLDRVRILKSFVESRTVKFGKAEAFPLFPHEDGSIYFKQ